MSALNVLLAVVAYLQRSKQIRGNRLREEQVRLAEARNEMAQSRLQRLEDQIALMTDIRDALQDAHTHPQMQDGHRPRPVVGVIDVGSVCDIGSGSTEISVGSLGGQLEVVGSFDVGSRHQTA